MKASPIASRMMSTTVEGAVTRGVWSTGCDRIASLHALGHEAVIVLDNHAVLLGDEEPGRPVLPQGPSDLDSDAGGRDRPLDRRQHRQLFLGSILREGGGEGRFGQIHQTMRVRGELRRLRMRRAASEHVRDRLAFVRGERGHIDERLHLVAARRPDDPAGIGVAGEDNGSLHSLERPVERSDVVVEGGQRQRRGHSLDAARREHRNDLRPTRPVGPGAVGEHHRRIAFRRHPVAPRIAQAAACNLIRCLSSVIETNQSNLSMVVLKVM